MVKIRTKSKHIWDIYKVFKLYTLTFLLNSEEYKP